MWVCIMADCIGTGFPQFSCALVQMRYSIGENNYDHILKGGGGGGGGGGGRGAAGKKVKEMGNGKKEAKRKRGWAVAVQVEPRIKQNKKQKFLFQIRASFTVHIVLHWRIVTTFQ